MSPEEKQLLRRLVTECRVLSLGVVVDGKPRVGLLPFVIANDYRSFLVHVSQLARHSRGLQPGSSFNALIHDRVDGEGDALHVARVSFSGTVQHVAQSDAGYAASRAAYVDRFPSSEQTSFLGDFNLYRLHIEWGRLVSGFALATNLSPESFAELVQG